MKELMQAYKLTKRKDGMITVEDRVTGEKAHFTPHNTSRTPSDRMMIVYRLLHILYERQEEEDNHHGEEKS